MLPLLVLVCSPLSWRLPRRFDASPPFSSINQLGLNFLFSILKNLAVSCWPCSRQLPFSFFSSFQGWFSSKKDWLSKGGFIYRVLNTLCGTAGRYTLFPSGSVAAHSCSTLHPGRAQANFNTFLTSPQRDPFPRRNISHGTIIKLFQALPFPGYRVAHWTPK